MFRGSDRFEVVDTLGEGGMGVVYEAVDRRRGMRVALKALRKVDPVSTLRFKQEFRAASELSHPNIVNLYELVADGDDLFFTMELVPGQSFIEFVRAGRAGARQLAPAVDPRAAEVTRTAAGVDTDTTVDVPLAPDVDGDALPLPADRPSVHTRVDLNRLRPAIRQLAEALQALHAAGLVHRDLKPSNIRVTPEERVVLMDFGIVADSRRTPRGAQTAVGTPPYMAPEQALGDPPTASADWYAFGSVLYLALTGQLPFRGTRREILVAKQRQEPPPPSELVSGVPRTSIACACGSCAGAPTVVRAATRSCASSAPSHRPRRPPPSCRCTRCSWVAPSSSRRCAMASPARPAAARCRS